jgi:hypothetical protein
MQDLQLGLHAQGLHVEELDAQVLHAQGLHASGAGDSLLELQRAASQAKKAPAPGEGTLQV